MWNDLYVSIFIYVMLCFYCLKRCICCIHLFLRRSKIYVWEELFHTLFEGSHRDNDIFNGMFLFHFLGFLWKGNFHDYNPLISRPFDLILIMYDNKSVVPVSRVTGRLFILRTWTSSITGTERKETRTVSWQSTMKFHVLWNLWGCRFLFCLKC